MCVCSVYRYIPYFVMTTKTGVELVDPIREERAGKVREVGSQAIWSLSSCKPGIFEIELMLQISVIILVKLNCSLSFSLGTLKTIPPFEIVP